MAKKQQDAATGESNGDAKANVDETVFGPLSEADLAALPMTEAERDAMGDDEEDDEAGDAEADAGEGDAEADAGEGEGEGADADTDADAGEGEGEGEADADADADTGADADAEAGADADGAAAADADADAQIDADAAYMTDAGPAIPDWNMPDKAQERLGALEAKGRDIASKFDAGDLTAGEYHAQMSDISDQKGKLLSQIDKATTAQDMRVAHFTKSTVPRFLRAHPEYDGEKNPVLYRALDGEVRALQEAAGQKGENYLSPEILRQAHINVAKAFGRPVAAPKNSQQQQGKNKPGLPDRSNKPGTPPTLARVPADAQEDVDGGKFVRLDRLARKDPMAYEEAIGKMSDTERDEYLRYA